MKRQHRYINILGYKMHYLTYGKGPAVLFIHGFGTDSYTWRNNIPFLSKYFRLYAPDLIGFGNSDKPEINYSRSFFTKQIYCFLQLLKISKATFIGASWGAGIALAFAVEFPGKVDKLIMIDSISPFSTPKLAQARQRRLKALKELSKGKKNLDWGKKVLEGLLKESYYNQDAVTKRVVSEQLKMWKTHKGRDALMAISAQCKFEDLINKFSKLNKKGLIIWGDKDPYFPLKSAKWLQGKIKNSQLFIIPNAGHAPHETHPNSVNQAILEFMRTP